MIFKNRSFSDVGFELGMNGTPLQRTQEEKDLRIHVNSDLKRSRPANYAANKANVVLGQLKRAYKYWTTQSFKKLFTAFFQIASGIRDCSMEPVHKKVSAALEKVQKRAKKFAHN